MKDKSINGDLKKKLLEMEQKLRMLESERNSIIDNIPFIAWIKDIDGKFKHVNHLFLDTFKLKLSDIIGKTEFDIFPYEFAQQYHQEDLKVIEQRKTINFQIKRDSEWFSTVKSPIFGQNGEILGTTGFERNITDNIETLNTLRKERDLLQALMESIPDAIYFKDIKGRFLRINKAKAIEIGMKNPYDAIGKSDVDFYDKERIESKFKDEELILSSGIPLISKEGKIIRADKKEVWVSTSKCPIKDDKGNIVGIVGISRDITNLKKTMQELNEERDFLQVLMDYIPYTIYFKDLECRFTKINKAQANLIGLENPDDAIGKSDFDFFTEEHAKSAFEDEKRIMSTGIPLIEKAELVKDSEEGYHWVSTTKIPVKDTLGNITGLVGISIDITKKRIAEEKLLESKEKAEESDRLKTAFLANMSHEIRTPMNGIIGFSNLLRNPDLTDEDKNDYLTHIISCGNTLLNLIDDIIDISKIEAGQIKIRFEESNLNSIIDELFESFNAWKVREDKEHINLIKKKGFTDIESCIMTDPFRLRQILTNLIGNALKFTLEGSVEFGYKLDQDDNILFYVTDTGIGIPQDKQQLIFERFGQVLDSNFYINQKGTGLGLAILSNLVKLLGGNMWVESEPGKGSTFYFNLPFIKIESTLKSMDKIKLNDFEVFCKGKTILIAEDEEVNYIFFKQIFKNTSAKLIWAKNGLEAVKAVKENPDISIVLMDCKMPKMDGYTATAKIKNIKPGLPVIAQTAFAMADEKDKSIQAGCDGYISKPIRINELLNIISKFLGSK